MSANGLSTLPTKQARKLAKLDIAQAKRQGYSAVVPAGSQQVNSNLYANPGYSFGALKVISDGAGHTYLVFEASYFVPAIMNYLYDGAPIRNIHFAGANHFDAVSIVGGLVDCSTLVGLLQPGARGYLLSATLGVTTNNNVGWIEIPNGRFTSSGAANANAPFYRASNSLDINGRSWINTSVSIDSAILSEAGDILTTEDGSIMFLDDWTLIDSAVLSEAGDILTTEDRSIIVMQ